MFLSMVVASKISLSLQGLLLKLIQRFPQYILFLTVIAVFPFTVGVAVLIPTLFPSSLMMQVEIKCVLANANKISLIKLLVIIIVSTTLYVQQKI